MIWMDIIKTAHSPNQNQPRKRSCYIMVIRINRKGDVTIRVIRMPSGMRYGAVRGARRLSKWAFRLTCRRKCIENFMQCKKTG